MSAIIEKAFDASKKIIRSIFKGSPNLITSSDLNRQIEAIKYQLDQLDDKTGVISDIEVTQNLSGGTLKVNYSFTYMRFKGCNFSPAVTELNTNLTVGAPTAYLCLVADSETLTYESDSSHDIAGAKFEDGTSLPAANQMVYKNESLMLTHALSTVTNLVGVIAVFRLSDAGNVVVQKNAILERDSLSLNRGGSIVDFDSTLKGTIGNGKTFDEAFSILENRAMNLCTTWTSLTLYSANSGAKMRFMIRNGSIFVRTSKITINYSGSSSNAFIVTLAPFPSDVSDKLVSLFKDFKLSTEEGFIDNESFRFVPFGEFGDFPVFATHSEYSGSFLYGRAKLCLYLQYYSNSDEIVNVQIGAYIDHLFTIKSNELGITTNFEAGPINWKSVTEVRMYIPPMFGSVALPGVF